MRGTWEVSKLIWILFKNAKNPGHMRQKIHNVNIVHSRNSEPSFFRRATCNCIQFKISFWDCQHNLIFSSPGTGGWLPVVTDPCWGGVRLAGAGRCKAGARCCSSKAREGVGRRRRLGSLVSLGSLLQNLWRGCSGDFFLLTQIIVDILLEPPCLLWVVCASPLLLSFICVAIAWWQE